ncbi:MAG TPA: ATP-binding cassette domain-containing protein [Ktedonobacteraceae bacterium]|nr:ATP-binding cassette domain-containing protein [Ktedonobacteraceae bacterium]HXZ06158.1 ATP-binding cassette domain-containing protein [Ktedonobacteraceae bacterium]HYA99734.1 ATP-binding cassette domain-containing protein [Ktedonobacteraceae bacterium]
MVVEPVTEISIDVQNLVKRYPKATFNAVDDISFSVRRGEIFGLLGPNGAGKTTTIGVLTTNIIPTSGSAHIMGIDVVADPMSVKQRIAVVPQQSNLDRSLRAREILTFHANYHGVPRTERNARADRLLEEFGLGDRGKDKVMRYSGGMAQRLMLARALMHFPNVLFLDEPTNSLDPQSRLFLWDRIRSLNEQGATILLTTHDMEEADQLCQRIAIMDHGKILVLDSPSELKKLIPGGTSLALRVRIPELVSIGSVQQDTHLKTQLLDALRSLPGVVKVEEVPGQDGEDEQQDTTLFRLYAENAGALVLQAAQIVADADMELHDLHLARPSLEDVFIYLTGRNLR